MKKIIIFTFSFFLVNLLSAQSFNWSVTSGIGPGNDRAEATCTDAQNNVYVVGSFKDSISIGVTKLYSYNASRDIFVAKYDSLGSFKWAYKMGAENDDYASDIKIDSGGNIYVSGYVDGDTAIFDSISKLIGGNKRVFLAKFNSSQKALWVNLIQVNADFSFLYRVKIAMVQNAKPIIACRFMDTAIINGTDTLLGSNATTHDILLAYFNSNGSLIWKMKTGGNYDDIFMSLRVDNAGTISMVGYYDYSTTIGSNTLTTGYGSGLYQFFIAKYSMSSSLWSWAYKGGAGYKDIPCDVEIEGVDGSFYFTGSFYGTTATMENTTIANHSAGSGETDVFVGKYNATGGLLFFKSFGGNGSDYGTAMTQDALGNIFIAGQTGLKDANIAGQNISEYNQIFVAKIKKSNNGHYVWELNSVNNSNSTAWPTDITLKNSLNIYLSGYTNGGGYFTNTTFSTSGFLLTKIYDDAVCKSTPNLSMRSYSVSQTSAGMRWDPVNGAESYQLQLREVNTSTWNTYSVPENVKVITNLNPGINYEWQVSSVCGVNNSSYASYQTFNTLDTATPNVFNWYSAIELYNGAQMDRGDDQITSVDHDASGNIYLAGTYYDSLTIGEYELRSIYNSSLNYLDADAFIAKFDSNGTLIWFKPIYSAASDKVTGVKVSGNKLYVVGRYAADIVFGNQHFQESGNYDQFIAMYDLSGNLQWAKQIVSENSTPTPDIFLDVDSSGNAYVAGSYSGTLTCGSTSLTAYGSDIFFFKVNSSGTLVDASSTEGTGDQYISGLAVNKQGNIFVTGYQKGTGVINGNTVTPPSYYGSSRYMSFAGRYINNDVWSWVKTNISVDNMRVQPVAAYDNNDIIVGGTWNGDFAYFGDKIYDNTWCNDDAYLAKYNSTGNLNWAKFVRGPGYSTVKALTINDQGKVFIGGEYSSECYFDKDLYLPNTSYNYSYNNNLYLSQIDSAGKFLWVTNPNLTNSNNHEYAINGLDILHNGSLLFGGSYKGNSPYGNNITLRGENSVSSACFGSFIYKEDCQSPASSSLKSYGVGRSNATLSWSAPITSKKYQVMYHDVNSSNWDTVYTINTALYLKGLTSNTLYEWDVVSICDYGYTTSTGNYQQFTTLPDTSTSLIRSNLAIEFKNLSQDDEILDITTDQNNYIYITGYHQGDIEFGGKKISAKNCGWPYGQKNYFVAKLDSDYNVIWSMSGGSAYYDDYGNAIAVDNSGNIFVSGIFNGTAQFGNTVVTASQRNVFLMKLDPDGNVSWVNTGDVTVNSNTPGDLVNGLTLDKNGDVYITGTFNANATFGSSTVTATGYPTGNNNNDIYIVKYSSAGTLTFARKAGNSSSEYGNSIAIDSNLNIFLSGYYETSTSIGSINLSNPGYPNNNFVHFVGKYTPATNTWNWAKSSSNGYAKTSLQVSPGGDYIACGGTYLYSHAIFNNKVGEGDLGYNGATDNGFVVTYDKLGNQKWVTSMDAQGTFTLKKLILDNKYNLYYGGQISSNGGFLKVGEQRFDYPSACIYSCSMDNLAFGVLDSAGNSIYIKVIENKSVNYRYNSFGLSTTKGIILAGAYYDNGYSATFEDISLPLHGDGYTAFLAQYHIDNQPCPEVTDFEVLNVTPVSASLKWNSTQASVKYKVEYKTLGSGTWSSIITTNNSIIISGLSPNTDYVFQITSMCLKTNSQSSVIDTFTTLSLNTVTIPNYQSALFTQVDAVNNCSGQNTIRAIAADQYKNIYTANNFNGMSYWGDSTLISNNKTYTWPYLDYNDIVIVKTDSFGTVKWDRKIACDATGAYGSSANSIAVDASGNVYVAGFFSNTAIFGTTIVKSTITRSMFLAKYDNNGNFQWVRTGEYDFNSQNSLPNVWYNLSMDIDTAGNIFVGGTFYGNAAFGSNTVTATGYPTGNNNNDIYVVKYSATGSVLFARKFGNSSDEILTGLKCSGNNLFFSGLYQNSTSFGSVNISNPGYGSTDYMAFILKYNPAGSSVTWAKSGTKTLNPVLLSLDNKSNPIITGYFDGTGYFGSKTISNSNGNIYLAKYNVSNGAVHWAKCFGNSTSESVKAITCDTSNNIFLTGRMYYYYYWTKQNFSPFTGSISGQYLTKLDSGGNFLWVNGNNKQYENSEGTALVKSGNSLYTGTILYNNASYKFGQINKQITKGDFASALFKMEDIGYLLTDTLKSNTYCAGDTIKVPFHSSGIANGTTIYLELSDANGNLDNAILLDSISLSKAQDTIKTLVPINSAYGTLYRVRVYAKNPEIMGSNNGKDITVKDAIAAFNVNTFYNGASICSYDSTGIDADWWVYYYYTNTYQWYKNGVKINGKTDHSSYFNSDGIYKLEVTNTNGCKRMSDNNLNLITHSAPTKPTVNYSGSFNLCDGDTAVLSTTLNGNTIQWYYNGYAIYPGNDSFYRVTTNGIYNCITTNQYGCASPASTPDTFQFNQLPYGQLYTPYTTSICKGDSVYMYFNPYYSYSGLTYEWYYNGVKINGSTNSDMYAKDSGKYSVKVITTSGCSSLFDLNINVSPVPTNPTIYYSGSKTLCNGDTAFLKVSNPNAYNIQWTYNGYDIYGANDTFYNVTYSGAFACRFTNSNYCSSNSINIDTFIFNSSPYNSGISIGYPYSTSICKGDSVQLYYYYASSGYNYKWYKNGALSANDTLSYFYAKDSANYSLKVANSSGCAITMSQFIQVNPTPQKPTISFVSPDTICQGDTFKVYADSGYSSYTWYGGFGSVTYSSNSLYYWPYQSDSIYVTVSNSYGCSNYSKYYKLTVNPQPTNSQVYGGNSFCQGDSTYLYYPYYSSGSYNYQWLKNGSPISNTNNFFYYATDSGDYRVIVKAGAKCLDTMQGLWVTMNLNPANPKIAYSGSNIFCQGQNLVLKSSISSYAYTWFNLAGNILSYTDSLAINWSDTVYFVAYTSSNCFAFSDTVIIQVNPAPQTPNINYTSSTGFCNGDSVILYSSSSTSNQWELNGSPVNGATDTFLVVKNSGNYTVTVNNSYGCKATSATTKVTVFSNPATPQLTYYSSTTFCNGDSLILHGPYGNYTYKWYQNSGLISNAYDSFYSAFNAGSYHLTIIDSNGCSATSSDVSIYVNPSPNTPVITFSNATICQGDSVILHSSSTTGNQWYLNGNAISNATDSIYIVYNSGDYSLMVSNSYGCSKQTQSQKITVNPLPSKPSSFANNTTICSKDTVMIDVYNKVSGVTYKVYDAYQNGNYIGNIPLSQILNSSTIYYIEAEQNGCINSGGRDSIKINVNPVPNNPTILYNGNTTICQGDHIDLYVNNNYQFYQWYKDGSLISSGANDTLIQTIDSGDYTVKVFNTYGCTSVSQSSVTVKVNTHNFGTAFTESQRIFFTPPFTVAFTNNTPNKSNYTYIWYFGDGTTSTQSDPTHNYSTNDSFTVSLIAISKQTGCVDSIYKDKWIITTGNCTLTANILQGSPIDKCYGDTAKLSCNNKSTYSYQWMNYGSIISGATSYTFDATQTGSYTVKITEGNCTVVSKAVLVYIHSLPQKPAITPMGSIVFCTGGKVDLVAPSGFSSYKWNTGETTQTIQVTKSGYYTVAVSDNYACKANSDTFILNTTAASPAQICKVSVDTALGRNVIVWDNPKLKSIDSVLIFRESSVANVYDQIGHVAGTDLSKFTDLTSNPVTRSYSYKIGLKDTCGQISLLSDTARTVFLQVSPRNGGGWNLDWNEYRGVNKVQTYRIYRRYPTKDSMDLIAELAGGNTKFSDTANNKDIYYEIVVVLANQCTPATALGFDSTDAWSFSNIVHMSKVGIDNSEFQFSSELYPNPNTGIFNLKIESIYNSNYAIQVYNEVGQLVDYTTLIKKTNPVNNYQFDYTQLQAGVYFMRISNDKNSTFKRFIIVNQ